MVNSLVEWLDRYFEVSKRGSTVRREIIAGLTTFMTMAYILFVNPAILSAAGVPAEGVVAATAVSAAAATLFMGLYARTPFALAPGMGLNSFFAFTAVPLIASSLAAKNLEGYEAWQIALAIVFIEGALFIILSLSGVREAIANSIPSGIKYGTAAGIGLFLTLIGFNVVDAVGPSGPEVVGVQINIENMTSPPVVLAFLGLLLAGTLMALNIPGALLLTIIILMVVGWVTGVSSLPSSIASAPEFSAAFKLDFGGLLALGPFIALGLIFTFFMVDFFDTLGTVTGLSAQSGLMDEKGRIPGLKRILLSDALGTSLGALLGTSTVTTYIESAAGIESGGRTGLTALIVGLLFLLGLIFTPILASTPSFATAPVLIIVGLLMASAITKINLRDPTEAIPAFLVIVGIPFTFSISDGLGLGFISYTALKIASGRARELNPIIVIVSLVFLLYFASLPEIHAVIAG